MLLQLKLILAYCTGLFREPIKARVLFFLRYLLSTLKWKLLSLSKYRVSLHHGGILIERELEVPQYRIE